MAAAEVFTSLDGRCISYAHPWSIPDLSLPNAQLAGVLAGFMVLAITTLLLQRNGQRVGHTLALFAAGVLILGIDSYLFGSISATKPIDAIRVTPAETSKACKIAWIQVMPAAGLLGLGAAFLVAGIGWMLTQHAVSEERVNKKLTTLGNILNGMVLAGTTGLLIYTSCLFVDHMASDFIRIAPDGSPERDDITGEMIPAITGDERHRAFLGIAAFSMFLAVTLISIIVPKTFLLMSRLSRKPLWDQVQDPRHNAVELLSIAAGVLVIVSIGVTVVLPNWNHIIFFDFQWPPWRWYDITSNYQLWWSLAMCLGAPGFLFILIAYSMPGPYSCFKIKRRRGKIEERYKLDNGRLTKIPIKEVQQFDVVFEIVSGRSYTVQRIRPLPEGWRVLQLKSNYRPASRYRNEKQPTELTKLLHQDSEIWRGCTPIPTAVSASDVPAPPQWVGFLLLILGFACRKRAHSKAATGANSEQLGNCAAKSNQQPQ